MERTILLKYLKIVLDMDENNYVGNFGSLRNSLDNPTNLFSDLPS